jgi:uncharacterized protein (DUF1778 family)
MAHKSTKKSKPRINVRFRDRDGYRDVVKAAEVKDTPVTRFIEKASIAAAREFLKTQKSGEINA